MRDEIEGYKKSPKEYFFFFFENTLESKACALINSKKNQ